MSSIIRMKFTKYFLETRLRPDRAIIKDAWVAHAMLNPEREVIQKDGRVRRWARIAEADGRVLRIVLLEDGETVHNAFFDRGMKL